MGILGFIIPIIQHSVDYSTLNIKHMFTNVSGVMFISTMLCSVLNLPSSLHYTVICCFNLLYFGLNVIFLLYSVLLLFTVYRLN